MTVQQDVGVSRIGNVAAMVRLVSRVGSAGDGAAPGGSALRMRQMIADLCRLVGADYAKPGTAADCGLPPRQFQTLERLLEGDSEKQIAARLGLSRHTVHVYVKELYKRFDVCSRAELLSQFVRAAP